MFSCRRRRGRRRGDGGSRLIVPVGNVRLDRGKIGFGDVRVIVDVQRGLCGMRVDQEIAVYVCQLAKPCCWDDFDLIPRKDQINREIVMHRCGRAFVDSASEST